ncbi:MAG: hypothetical protein V3V16_00110 [Melioribacteraceae bacterium]
MQKLVLYIIFGYLIYKASKFVMRMFAQVKPHSDEPKVHQTKKGKTKISDKDIIDAKFEELPPKDNPTSE